MVSVIVASVSDEVPVAGQLKVAWAGGREGVKHLRKTDTLMQPLMCTYVSH